MSRVGIPISAKTRSIEEVKNEKIYFITANNDYGRGTYYDMTPPPSAENNDYLSELKLVDVEILTPDGLPVNDLSSITLTFPRTFRRTRIFRYGLPPISPPGRSSAGQTLAEREMAQRQNRDESEPPRRFTAGKRKSRKPRKLRKHKKKSLRRK